MMRGKERAARQGECGREKGTRLISVVASGAATAVDLDYAFLSPVFGLGAGLESGLRGHY